MDGMDLTPRGWESGSESVDFGKTEWKDPPVDRVLTMRRLEEQTSQYSQMHRGIEQAWASGDGEALNALKAKFGKPPKHL
jgi:hypothetical protein